MTAGKGMEASQTSRFGRLRQLAHSLRMGGCATNAS